MTFLYLNSEAMGTGDIELGKKLLKSFLNQLLRSDAKVDLIGCVNTAIHLTTEGSEVIDILSKFEEKGTSIASCGTCLEYFRKKDKLLIGSIGTMEQSVQIMLTADKVIRP